MQAGEVILPARNWWSVVLRGIAAVVFGILTLALPGITVSLLVIWFGAYALVDGVVNLVGAFRAAHAHGRWGAFVVEGIIGVVAGILTFAWPSMTALALVYFIAIWSIATGVFELVAAMRLRKHISGEWLLALAGVASILFGVALMAVPIAGALVLAIWVGVYALVFGGSMIALGFRLRRWANTMRPLLPRAATAG